MAHITAKRRNALPSSEFGLPSERKYPVDTHNRAANAKARAKQQFERGHIDGEQYRKVVAKANRVLGKRKP